MILDVLYSVCVCVSPLLLITFDSLFSFSHDAEVDPTVWAAKCTDRQGRGPFLVFSLHKTKKGPVCAQLHLRGKELPLPQNIHQDGSFTDMEVNCSTKYR